MKIKDIVKHAFCPPSTVIGIDRYTLKAFDGSTQHWDSYTLVSDEKGTFGRWWIVDVPKLGMHYYVATQEIQKDAQLIRELSGYVQLHSEGNADLSSGAGALAVYGTSDGTLYAEEVFDGADRMVFIAHKISP